MRRLQKLNINIAHQKGLSKRQSLYNLISKHIEQNKMMTKNTINIMKRSLTKMQIGPINLKMSIISGRKTETMMKLIMKSPKKIRGNTNTSQRVLIRKTLPIKKSLIRFKMIIDLVKHMQEKINSMTNKINNMKNLSTLKEGDIRKKIT